MLIGAHTTCDTVEYYANFALFHKCTVLRLSDEGLGKSQIGLFYFV